MKSIRHAVIVGAVLTYSLGALAQTTTITTTSDGSTTIVVTADTQSGTDPVPTLPTSSGK